MYTICTYKTYIQSDVYTYTCIQPYIDFGAAPVSRLDDSAYSWLLACRKWSPSGGCGWSLSHHTWFTPGGSSVGNKSPVINGISRVNPLITGDITYLVG